MFRNHPNKLKYTYIPHTGAIAISPSTGDTHADRANLSHFIANVADARLDNTNNGKELHVYIGTGLHILDDYARIVAQSKKKNSSEDFRKYKFSQLSDGKTAYQKGLDNGNRWLLDRADALCTGVREAVEVNRPALVNLTEQHIYINTPDKNEIYGRSRKFDSQGSAAFTLHIHHWHELWAGQEHELNARLNKILHHFNQGQTLVHNKSESDINVNLAGTDLTSKIMKEINATVRMNRLTPFTEDDYQYWPAALGLSVEDFTQERKEQSALKTDDNTSRSIYADIMLATWQYFKQSTALHCQQYLDAGITQEQIEAVFRANLMFTLSEVATLSFFPDHILYMVPASMDKIYPHLNACAKLLFNKPLSLPIQATDAKQLASSNNSNHHGSSSSSSTQAASSTKSMVTLSGGYIGNLDRDTVLSQCTNFMANSKVELHDSMLIVQTTLLAWKQAQEQKLLQSTSGTTANVNEVASKPNSDSSKSNASDSHKNTEPLEKRTIN